MERPAGRTTLPRGPGLLGLSRVDGGRDDQASTSTKQLERVTGIEPALSAWEPATDLGVLSGENGAPGQTATSGREWP
jgi:hypothetical protein